MNDNQPTVTSSSPQGGKRKGGAKFYVVWNGESTGIFTSWEECQEAIHGVPGAKYKSFKSFSEAEDAFNMGYEEWKAETSAPSSAPTSVAQPQCNESSSAPTSVAQPQCKESSSIPASTVRPPCASASAVSLQQPPAAKPLPKDAIRNAIAVDAACSGNPGPMEYRGVYLANQQQIFHYGPVHGTNNIGEFLAIVHGLALLKQKGLHDMPIYSDSVNAQLWVHRKHCKTTLARNEKTEPLYQMIERAEKWLRENTYRNPILKWPTDEWGEIPADFGRK